MAATAVASVTTAVGAVLIAVDLAAAAHPNPYISLMLFLGGIGLFVTMLSGFRWRGKTWTKVNAVINFAREAVRAEVMTPTGILNAIWILVVLVLVSVVGLADLYQVVVRTLITDYESGLPSFLWMLLTAGGLTLACIFIVGLFTTGWR